MKWLYVAFLAAVLLSLPPELESIKDKLKCPPRLLKGGRVRIRSRGRVIKYVCLRGYQVLGNKYSTCIRGQWDSPAPICIKGGCETVDVVNGQVLETYRGAVVTVHCDPGYQLIGTRTLYCNGAKWNDTVPYCKEINVTTQKWCDFESEDLCGWTHDLNHDFDWRRHSFATPSGHVGTGPSFDHTLGPGLNGHYLYLETSSPRLENDTARLFSPVFSAPSSPVACFIFWYHMYGLTTGFLNVYLHHHDSMLLFSQSGDQGNQWKQAVLPLPPLNTSFQIVIEGVRGTGYEGDTAIDDVRLGEGDECVVPPSTTDMVQVSGEGSDGASCEGRCLKVTSDPLLCECTTDCVTNNTCCPDFLVKCSRLSVGSPVVTSSLPRVSMDQEISLATNLQFEVPTTPTHTKSFEKSSVTTLTPLLVSNVTTPSTSKTSVPSIIKQSVVEESLSKSTTKTTTPKSTKTFSKITTLNPHLVSNATTFPTLKVSIPTVVKQSIAEESFYKSTTETSSNQLPATRSNFRTASISLKTTEFLAKLPNDKNIKTTTSSQHWRTKIGTSTTPSRPLVSTNSTTSTVKAPRAPTTTTSSPKILVTTTAKNIPATKTMPVFSKTTSKKEYSWIPQTSSTVTNRKIEFITPPPPIVFRKLTKTTPFLKSQKLTTTKQSSTNTSMFMTSTPNPKVLKTPTKDASKSKNDVLHPFWKKGMLSPPPLPTLGPMPGLRTWGTTKSSRTVAIKKSKLYENYLADQPSDVMETEWKPKYKAKDQAPVLAQFSKSSPSSEMVHILVIVAGVLLLLASVLATVCMVRQRKINRRSIEDDELDIRFLASDEILDFTLARPNTDDVCETSR